MELASSSSETQVSPLESPGITLAPAGRIQAGKKRPRINNKQNHERTGCKEFSFKILNLKDLRFTKFPPSFPYGIFPEP